MSSRADFIGYEYKDITVNQEQESLFVDGYTNFGWDLDSIAKPIKPLASLKIKFKRDRKIRNKAELTRLQRQFDACVDEMEQLERSKKNNGTNRCLRHCFNWNDLHGGFGFCSDERAYPTVCHFCGARFYRLDYSVFLL